MRQLLRHRHRRAAASLRWSLIAYVTLHAGAAACLELGSPCWRDPEYALKEARLKQLLAESPGKRITLLLGSSRAMLGFEPGRLMREPSTDLFYNFAVRGGGPMIEWLCLDRLLAQGIRPDHLLVEVLPPLLIRGDTYTLEEVWLQGQRCRLPELAKIRNWHGRPERLTRGYIRRWLAPWKRFLHGLETWKAPEGERTCPEPGILQPGEIDRYGWESKFPDGISPEQRERLTAVALDQYLPALHGGELSRPSLDGLAALLHRCSHESIPVTLLLMPEASSFRCLYDKHLETEVGLAIAAIARQHSARLLDCRAWVPDDNFWDTHHLLPAGAHQFTDRLRQELDRSIAWRDVP